jgi:catechol 2,3-dioxygenase-like lactoylglutathione lyase family enzyme
MATIDHLILSVNDVAASVDFYVNILGFEHGGKEGPFTVIRVSQDFILQLAPWGTDGNEHLAFALSRKAFDRVFALVKEKGIPYGDSYHSVGNNSGPGVESGARGIAPTVYMMDPNKHLIEIRTYDGNDTRTPT